MTAGGEAVLNVARGEIGYVEGPNNSTKYWDWYGANLGSWCAVFVSWCASMAGYPMCPIDSDKGFVLVSNGTWHSYKTGMDSNTGLEAQRTGDLQPGDVVLYSWEPWDWYDGVPTCSTGQYQGWTAGDHTGVVATPPDSSGYFTAIEGNTSDGSADNGGMVLERTRHKSQVCGWWRFLNINTGGGAGPAPGGQDDDMYQTCLVTTQGHPWNGSVFLCAGGRAMGMSDANIVANLQARGLAGPTISVEAWDIYGGFEVCYPSGPGAVPG